MNTRLLSLLLICSVGPLGGMNQGRPPLLFDPNPDLSTLTDSERAVYDEELSILARTESMRPEYELPETPLKALGRIIEVAGTSIFSEYPGQLAIKDPRAKRQFQKNRSFLDPEKTQEVTTQGTVQLRQVSNGNYCVVSKETFDSEEYTISGKDVLPGNIILLPPSKKNASELVLTHPCVIRWKNGTVCVADYKEPENAFEYYLIISRVAGNHPEKLGLNGKFVVVTQADGSTISWDHEKILKILRNNPQRLTQEIFYRVSSLHMIDC